MVNSKVLKTEWSDEFTQKVGEDIGSPLDETFISMAQDEVVSGYYKYGPIANSFPSRSSGIKSATKGIDCYIISNKPNHLLNCYNFIMFEYILPAVPTTDAEPAINEGPAKDFYHECLRLTAIYNKCGKKEVLIALGKCIYNEYM